MIEYKAHAMAARPFVRVTWAIVVEAVGAVQVAVARDWLDQQAQLFPVGGHSWNLLLVRQTLRVSYRPALQPSKAPVRHLSARENWASQGTQVPMCVGSKSMASVDAVHSLEELAQERPSFAVGTGGLESQQGLLRSSAEWAIMEEKELLGVTWGQAVLLDWPRSARELLARHITRGVRP